jgi:hypothetical protein
MTEDRRRHRTLVVWAFFAAPACGAVTLGVVSATSSTDASVALATAIIGAVVGYVIALVLGVPSYLILRRRLRPRLVYPVLVGGLIAAGPFALGGLGGISNPAGLATLVVVLGQVFLSGAAGGFAFWLIAMKADPHADRHFGPQKEQPADAFD